MKGLIVIDFEEIAGKKITEELEKQSPEIKKSAEVFMAKFCKETLLYLKQKNIKAGIDFKVV